MEAITGVVRNVTSIYRISNNCRDIYRHLNIHQTLTILFSISDTNIDRCFTFLDINECAQDEDNNCHANANCTNLDGTFNCTCNKGYSGNGVNCTGKINKSLRRRRNVRLILPLITNKIIENIKFPVIPIIHPSILAP